MGTTFKKELKDIRKAFNDAYRAMEDFPKEIKNIEDDDFQQQLITEWEEIQDRSLILYEKLSDFSSKLIDYECDDIDPKRI